MENTISILNNIGILTGCGQRAMWKHFVNKLQNQMHCNLQNKMCRIIVLPKVYPETPQNLWFVYESTVIWAT